MVAKRLLLVTPFLLLPVARAQTQTLTGYWPNPDGSALNGSLRVELRGGTYINTCLSPTQRVPQVNSTFPIVGGYAQLNGAQFVSTDCLSPHVPYYVRVSDATGKILSEQNWFMPRMAGAKIDVGTVSATKLGDIPISVQVPNAMIETPSVNQITTQPPSTYMNLIGDIRINGLHPLTSLPTPTPGSAGANATATTPGLVQLAPGETSYVLSKIASSGQASDLLNGNDIVLPASPDLGAQICAVTNNLNGQPATLEISQPGQVIQSTCVVPNNITFKIHVGVVWNAYLIPSSGDAIFCDADSAVQTNGMRPNNTVSDGTNPYLYVPPNAPELIGFKVHGCTWNGYGASQAEILNNAGPVQDVEITGNKTQYATFWKQEGAPASNPSLRVLVAGNKCIWPSTGNGLCALVYGALQNSVFAYNIFSGPLYGIELFASTSTGLTAANFPNQAAIETSGLQDNLVIGNNCYNTRACAWTSLATRTNFVGNTANVCSDVCFDHEAGSNNIGYGNLATAAYNGAYALEYGGYSNKWISNTALNGPGWLDTSPTFNTSLLSNTYNGGSNVGILFYMEGTDSFVNIENNDVTNGILAYNNYISSELVVNNKFLFTASIPSSGVGNPNGSGCGLTLGNTNDSTYAVSKNNTLITTVPQTQAALCAAFSQTNNTQSALFQNDTILATSGTWATDVAVGNSSSQPLTSHNFVFRDVQFSNGKISTFSQYGGKSNIVCSGSHVGPASAGGYYLNGSTVMTACN